MLKNTILPRFYGYRDRRKWKTCYELKFFLVGCARNKDRATLTDIFTDDNDDDDELFSFRVKLRVPWQASRLLSA